LVLLEVVVSACDAPQRAEAPAPARARETPVALPMSKQQADELSAQCGKMSRQQFKRAWRDGKDGPATADYTNHYNTKLKVCFYLLTVSSPGTLKKMLFDINSGELYGEFLGPPGIDSPAASRPKTCQIDSYYCASAREWDVLVGPYMQE
jgi:hypothetical protein